MIPALLVAATLTGVAPDFELQRRAPLLLIESSAAPSKDRANLDLAPAIAAAIEGRTKLVLVRGDAADVDLTKFHACAARGRMSCWARTVRERSQAPFVIIAGAQPSPPSGARVSLVLLDVEQATELLASGRPADEIELELVTSAVRSASGVVVAENARELARFIDAMLVEKLREPFERSGEWGAYGTMELMSTTPGLAIELDGKRIGAARVGITTVAGVDEERHELVLVEAANGRTVYATEVLLAQGSTTRVVADIIPRERSDDARKLTFWAGAGVAAIGAAVLVYALAAKPGYSARRLCFGSGCTGPESGGFLTTGDLDGQRTHLAAPGGRSGLPIAPLGYSLMLLGGTWAIGTAIEDSEGPPLIPLLAGVLAGAASLGLSIALD